MTYLQGKGIEQKFLFTLKTTLAKNAFLFKSCDCQFIQVAETNLFEPCRTEVNLKNVYEMPLILKN